MHFLKEINALAGFYFNIYYASFIFYMLHFPFNLYKLKNPLAPFCGYLDVKEIGILKTTWRQCYFTLIEGTLFQFNSEVCTRPSTWKEYYQTPYVFLG